MMDKAFKLLRRHLAMCVLIAVVLTLAISAFAEFTMSRRAKRVVASYGVSEILFSSNILRQSTVPYLKYVSTENPTGDELKVTVTLCNFAQGNKLAIFSNDIPYTITAWLINADGTVYTGGTLSGASVKPEGESTEILGRDGGYNATLNKSGADTDRFTVTFDPAMLISGSAANPVYIHLEVTQSQGGIPNKLSANLGLALRNGDAAASWSGYFDEDQTKPIDDFSGFNYIITGSGTASVTLTWDSSVVTLSDVSLKQELGDPVVTTNGTMKSVTLSVSSVDEIDGENVIEAKPRYAIQFFRNTSGSIADWATLEGSVTCSMGS